MHHLKEGSIWHGLVRDDNASEYPSAVCSTSYGMLPQSRRSGQGATMGVSVDFLKIFGRHTDGMYATW